MSRKFRELLDGFDLTPSQWGVLASLWNSDGQPTLQVGRGVDLLPGTLTGVIRKLERNGFVKRRRDQNDARVWRLWLTPAAKRLERKLLPEVNDLMQGYFADFTESDFQCLSDLVDRLRTSVSPVDARLP